jgi:RHS repeat-associated protein
VTDVSGTTDYGYQGDRATTLSGALSASIAYDFAGRATSRVAAGLEVEGFVHDTLDRLTQVRRSGALSEILEYAPTGELLFRKLGTQGTWYVGSVGTVTATVAAGCLGIDTIRTAAGYVCWAVPGTEKVSAHVQVAGGRVASIRAAAGAGVDPVSEVLYYHRDMQGSVVATTYRTGGLSGYLGARYRYTPYGQLDRAENVTTLSDSELGYTGGLRLGYAAGAAQQGSLVLLGARVYHAELKRWLVPDTVDGRRYTYAGGDPVNFVDPGGRRPKEIGKATGLRYVGRFVNGPLVLVTLMDAEGNLYTTGFIMDTSSQYEPFGVDLSNSTLAGGGIDVRITVDRGTKLWDLNFAGVDSQAGVPSGAGPDYGYLFVWYPVTGGGLGSEIYYPNTDPYLTDKFHSGAAACGAWQHASGHNGIDLRNPWAEPVFAPFRGTVTFAPNTAGGGGNQIYVTGSEVPFQARIAHSWGNNELEDGSNVEGGTLIGFSDGSGPVGPHLHFGLWPQGGPTNYRANPGVLYPLLP